MLIIVLAADPFDQFDEKPRFDPSKPFEAVADKPPLSTRRGASAPGDVASIENQPNRIVSAAGVAAISSQPIACLDSDK